MTASPPPRDRRQFLLAPGATLNGIDYVEVADRPDRSSSVHFLNRCRCRGTLSGARPPP